MLKFICEAQEGTQGKYLISGIKPFEIYALIDSICSILDSTPDIQIDSINPHNNVPELLSAGSLDDFIIKVGHLRLYKTKTITATGKIYGIEVNVVIDLRLSKLLVSIDYPETAERFFSDLYLSYIDGR